MNELLKKIRLKNLIASVPPELEEPFDQMQLKNSIYRLKLLGVITIFFNALNLPIYIIRNEFTSILLLITDLCYFFIVLLFFLLTNYFSKKSKHPMLWFMCYLFIILQFILSLYYILFTEIFLVLQIFFTCSFLYTFVPDFKPKIFISFLTLWYLALAGLLTYNNYSFVIVGPQLFALDIFFIALVVKILQYNYKVETFIDIFKINSLNEKLKALSTIDELTKLDNRRSFLEHIDLIWKQNHRLNLPVTILMIDVDYFKKYNDSLGHLEGDKALIAIAKCMKNHIKRETDFVARFGGEEFVCLLPFIEKNEALEFAKTLVQDVENMKMPHPMSEHSKYVTISVGLASTVPNDNNSYTQLLDEADKALYSAKKSGRNRVIDIQ
ncbi:response regulator [Fibrobacteria bacterium R8-3-H12]